MTSRGDSFQIILLADGEEMWRAFYDRTISTGVGWEDGDREAYRCAYMFLINRGQVAGRATFTRIQEAASYAMVNDKYMDEGKRYFDGTVDPTPNQHTDCPEPDEKYEPYFGPDERRVIEYRMLGRVKPLETRDYRKVVAGPGVTFRQVLATPKRVTIIAHKDSQPIFAVYYDAIHPRVTMHST